MESIEVARKERLRQQVIGLLGDIQKQLNESIRAGHIKGAQHCLVMMSQTLADFEKQLEENDVSQGKD